VLMYDDVRAARSPSAALRDFCESTLRSGRRSRAVEPRGTRTRRKCRRPPATRTFRWQPPAPTSIP
jgi:hypothetical protein